MHTAVAIIRVDYTDAPSNDVLPTEIIQVIEELLAEHGGGQVKVISVGVSGKPLRTP